MNSDTDLAYLAGIIDGEGSIGYFAGVFTIEVKMTHKPIIDALQARFSGSVTVRKPQKEGWKEQYRWRVKCKLARNAYEELKPYLRLKVL